MTHKPITGIYTFTCCQGCQFTILFLDNLLEVMDKLDIKNFDLLKEKKQSEKYDLVFVEGAITTKTEVRQLKAIRKKAKFLVSLGACACHGGIPAMRNFIENKALEKYVYNQRMLDDSLPAAAIDQYVKVDYYMYGCPIIKKEFVDFVDSFCNGIHFKEFAGPVCDECPRRGKNCLLLEKKPCLGAISHGGCYAICPIDNIPCILCRGPLPKANYAAEVNLFKKFGLEEKDIVNKLNKFKHVELK